MKAQELRIGNLVKIEGENHKLYDIFGTGQIGTVRLGINYMSNIGEIEPIPLTEEWLVKFGFKPLSNDWQKDGIIIHTRKRGYVLRKSVPIVKYVHNLQNLYFALIGKELI